MIRRGLAIVGALALVSVAWQGRAFGQTPAAEASGQPPGQSHQPAQRGPHPPAPSPSPHEPDETLTRFRTPFEALTDRAIGRTSRRVRYDWRRGLLQVGATGGLPAELNNYDSLRAGGFARMPVGDLLAELGLAYVWVRGSESTERLALTPYRQPGRPARLELDFAASYAIAEGVITAYPRLIPTTQLVLNARATFRYLIYPSGYADLGLKDTLKALVTGSLSDDELENLEDQRLPGMEIDRGRYALLVGLSNDVYFGSGLFFSYELLVAVPVLKFMTETELDLGYELDLSVGVAF